MQNNKGYTIPELVVVAIIVGIFSIITINKVSYAFEDTNEVSEKTEEMVVKKSATVYAESIKNELKEESTKYILATDLIESGFLADDDLYKRIKIKLDYVEETDSVSVEILK